MSLTSSEIDPPAVAKLAQPRLRDIVRRGRLHARLATSGAPVVWIAAAPGSGKTTLAASYADASSARLLWYQVDAADGDPATFLYFMRRAVCRSSAAPAAALPPLPPEGPIEPAFAVRYFRALFSLLHGPTLIVIDNFQEAGSSAFHAVVRIAFEQLPENVSAIVTALGDPPSALTRLVANGSIARIGADELRFTRAESDQVVLSRLDADDAALAELHRRSDGWAAGLVLMMEHRRCAGGTAVPSLEESQRSVFDYFAGEILGRIPADEQRALMLTSSLPRVTAALATAMSGLVDAHRLLEHMHSNHLFVDRRVGDEAVYQYHGLFRAFLRDRAHAELPQSEIDEAAESAARLLETGGQAEDAITMYLAARRWDGAVDLILSNASRLSDQGRGRTVLEWIDALPDALVEARPWLLYWRGALQVWIVPAQARTTLEHAFARFVSVEDSRGQILTAGAACRACMHSADWRVVDPWLSALEALLAQDTTAIADDVLLTGYSRLLYVAFGRQPRHPQLGAWAERTLELLGADLAPSDLVLAGFNLLFHLVWTGQTSMGEQLIARIGPLAADARTNATARTYWQFVRSCHEARCGNPADALRTIDQALELAIEHGLSIAGVIRRYRVALLLIENRLGDAERELALLASTRLVEPYLELRAWLAWRGGDLARARDEADNAWRLAEERGRATYAAFDLALLAEIHAAAGSSAEATRFLQEYRQATCGMPGEFAAFTALWTEASLARRRGDRDACLTALRGALAIGRRQRYRSWWGWNPEAIVPLLTLALENGIAVAYVRDLISIHRLTPDTADVEHWPWPVSVRTFGRFEVRIDGVPLAFESKAQRRPLELLKMLVALGDRPIAVDRLIDQLWPHPEEGGQKAFDITVHRLRKLLGHHATIEVTDRHVRLASSVAWVDAWAFDRIVERLESIGEEPSLEALESVAPRILALVGGSFLEADIATPWQATARARWAGRLRRFVEDLGGQYERRARWDRADALYRRVIELEPLAESFYRRRMLCLREQGRGAEALEVFRSCRHILSTSLGVAPARETESLYRQIVDA